MVFNPLGGDTHLVSAALAQLIQVLSERGALDLAQLHSVLRPLFDAEFSDAASSDDIQGMLFALEQQYLVFRVAD